jgi:hypothetical protein
MDLDIAELDLRKSKRLAKAMNMQDGLNLWCERHRAQSTPSVGKGQIKRGGQVRGRYRSRLRAR